MIVLDQSNFAIMQAKWIHDIDQSKQVGSNTYLTEPGTIFRFPEHGTYSWYTKTLGQWARTSCFICGWQYSGYYGYIVQWTVIT